LRVISQGWFRNEEIEELNPATDCHLAASKSTDSNRKDNRKGLGLTEFNHSHLKKNLL